jgi:hypothetical protein
MASKSPSLSSHPDFTSLTNAINAAVDCRESAEILQEIQIKLSPTDPSTLQNLLTWYNRRYLKPPAWSVVLAINGQLNTKQGRDLISQVLKDFKKRSVAKLKEADAPISWNDNSDAAALCRQFDTKAILLLDLLPGDVRHSKSSLGDLIVGETSIRATIIRPGKLAQTETVEGVYKDFGNKSREFMLTKSFEEAASALTGDPSIGAELGIQLLLPNP